MNPSELVVPPPNPYKFKRPWQRKVTAFVDAVASKFFASESHPINWEKIKKIAFLRLDHIGDVLLLGFCINAFKKKFPHIEIDLWVGPWAEDAAKLLPNINKVHVFKAPWCERPIQKRPFLSSIFNLGKCLESEKYDVIIDFRGDFRHLWAMWLSKASIRIGQILTGGKFFLTHIAQFEPDLHISDLNLHVLAQTGLHLKRSRSLALNINKENFRDAERVQRILGISKKTIVLHIPCEVPSRRWVDKNWVELAEKLPANYDVVLIGSGSDQEYLESIKKKIVRKVIVAPGSFKLASLAAFLKGCKVFIGINSGPGHLAALVQTPVISLFSGTEPPHRWKPLGNRVTVLHKKTECWPCDRSICPFENDCMRRIQVEEVLRLVSRELNNSLSVN